MIKYYDNIYKTDTFYLKRTANFKMLHFPKKYFFQFTRNRLLTLSTTGFTSHFKCYQKNEKSFHLKTF